VADRSRFGCRYVLPLPGEDPLAARHHVWMRGQGVSLTAVGVDLGPFRRRGAHPPAAQAPDGSAFASRTPASSTHASTRWFRRSARSAISTAAHAGRPPSPRCESAIPRTCRHCTSELMSPSTAVRSLFSLRARLVAPPGVATRKLDDLVRALGIDASRDRTSRASAKSARYRGSSLSRPDRSRASGPNVWLDATPPRGPARPAG
jgi:hypothetical protein